MPTPCNLKVAEYPGSSEKEGREDTCDIFEIEHHIHQPVDTTSGSATGVRVHSPMRIVKMIDKATPGFHKALCTGQNLKEVVVTFYRIDPHTRSEDKYYEITLKNARIVDIQPFMPMSFVPANESYRHMEQVSFVYEEVEWNWMPDSVVEMDRWRAPGAA
ncbi:MAG: type VI secretion system tube protein Hcp [Phycisphaerales bacterium]|nr:MAG: type VI secretion system tube protein Hcp [Phycisphaerales bacterium]